jgi:hypothetical protein
MHLKNPKDFWAGVLFAVIGIAFAVVVKVYEYPMGTASRMGPGFFPFYLGIIMAILGGAIIVESMATIGGPVGKFAWKPILWILAAVVIFGLIAKWAGLVVAVIALVFISAYGGHEFRWKEVAITAVVLAIFSVLVFVKGLKQPFPIWPSMFGG